MKAYVNNEFKDLNCEFPDIEILCTRKELHIWIDALVKFQIKIDEFMEKNKNKKIDGYTHLHYQDCIEKLEPGDSDIVVYVDLSKEDTR